MIFDDAKRLKALRDYRVLDTDAEEAFDNITRLTAGIFGTPIVLVSLVDEQRQWFKSRVGLDALETPRDVAFCDHAIRQQEPLVVADATVDSRFRDNPLVTGEPAVRFYCGVPLRSPEGHGLGTLCIIDRHPREIDARNLELLGTLARQVELELELRRRTLLLEEGLHVQRQEQKGKELLASMLVHDLRGPLSSISLSLSVLASQYPESREQIIELLDSADQMRRMLSDILDICLAESGGLRARCVELVIQPLVRKVARNLRPIAAHRGQRLEVELPEAPLTIDADPELLDRVLMNLLGNAHQHGPSNGVIGLVVLALSDGGVRFEVRDQGAAIPAEARERVFRPFERLGLDEGREQRSHGLGLAFCRLAVEAHRGRLGVSASESGGNCFFFELPAPKQATA